MSTISQIPLYTFHVRQGARFVNFGGWNMPVQYTSIIEEHIAVRKQAGLFDVSHMGEFYLSGEGAALFLDKLLVNKIATIAAGKAVYSPMCDENGCVVDDLIVYRISKNEFLVCVNAGNIEKDFDWFVKHATRWESDVSIENHSQNYALLALQGPKAEAILQRTGFGIVNKIKKFEHITSSFSGKPIRICRTGYTGEDGFEIYIAPEIAEDFVQLLMEQGRTFGLKLCGLGCRDSLRLEAGYPLYGHELSSDSTPLEAGLSWTVKFQKDDFVGKAALTSQKEAGIPRCIIHFVLESRRIAREGTEIINADNEPVGKVVSGTLSPILKKPIGSALITSKAKNQPLFVDLRGNRMEIKVTRPPLYKVSQA